MPGGDAPVAGGGYPSEFWLRTLLRWYVGLVIRPGATVREIVERRPSFWLGLGSLWFGILASYIGTVAGILLASGGPDGVPLDDSEAVTALIVGPLAIAGYFAAAPVLLGLWVLVMHALGLQLGGRGIYSTSLVSMMLVCTVAFSAFGLMIVGFGLVYFNTSGFDVINAMLMTVLIAVVGGLVWGHVAATVLVRENYDLDTRMAIITVTVCIIPTFIFGLAAFVGWIWTLFAVVPMLAAMGVV